MPRNGSGVYSLPAGSTFSPNTLAQSAVVNAINQDLATDLNTPRPIVAGGTGAATASDALTALGFSTFAKTIIDDASGALMFGTMGGGGSGTTNGYCVLPSGQKFMWGSAVVTTTASGDLSVTFPTSFTTARQVIGINGDHTVPGALVVITENISAGQPLTGFNARAFNVTGAIASSVLRISWHAMGV